MTMNYGLIDVEELETTDRQNKVMILLTSRAQGQVISVDILDMRFISVLECVRFDFKGGK